MRHSKDYLALAKLADAAAARTVNEIARNYWLQEAEKNRRLHVESMKRQQARRRGVNGDPSASP